jgi:hypothetical protein
MLRLLVLAAATASAAGAKDRGFREVVVDAATNFIEGLPNAEGTMLAATDRLGANGHSIMAAALRAGTYVAPQPETSEAYVYKDVLVGPGDKLVAFQTYVNGEAWVEVRDECDIKSTLRVADVTRASADQVTAFNAAVKGCKNFERYADQGHGKKDPDTGYNWKPETLEYYFARGRGLPATREDFAALGGGMKVYASLKAAKKRIEKRETVARHAEERKDGKYAGHRSFPIVDDKMVFVSQSDWENGGGINYRAAHQEYNKQKPKPATEVSVQTRPDDDRKPVEKFDPNANYAPDIHEPDTNHMSATSKYNKGDYPPQWKLMLENFDVKKPGDAAAAKALLVVMCVEFAHTLKSPEMIAAMVELTDRGVGNANPLPNMARIATMGPTKVNKLRVAGTEKLYEYETAGGTWKDRLHEITRVVGGDGKSVFKPNALLYFIKLYVTDEILERDPATHKVDKPGARARELQKLADKHRSPEGGGSMKISPTHLALFMVDYATVNGLMDWTECVLEACIHGVGGTANVLAGLSGRQRDAAIQGSGPHGLDTDRLSDDLDETQAVNGLQGIEFKEFSNVVEEAAGRGERVPFTIQFWRATTDAETGTALDPKIWEINDDVAVAKECFSPEAIVGWPEVFRKSQLFEALQHGPRLLMNRPKLKLDEFVDSTMFRHFLTRPKQSKKINSGSGGGDDDDDEYWWTIWYGLDYRLTYYHPTRKETITICPKVMRDQLRRARAAAAAEEP